MQGKESYDTGARHRRIRTAGRSRCSHTADNAKLPTIVWVARCLGVPKDLKLLLQPAAATLQVSWSLITKQVQKVHCRGSYIVIRNDDRPRNRAPACCMPIHHIGSEYYRITLPHRVIIYHTHPRTNFEAGFLDNGTGVKAPRDASVFGKVSTRCFRRHPCGRVCPPPPAGG